MGCSGGGVNSSSCGGVRTAHCGSDAAAGRYAGLKGEWLQWTPLLRLQKYPIRQAARRTPPLQGEMCLWLLSRLSSLRVHLTAVLTNSVLASPQDPEKAPAWSGVRKSKSPIPVCPQTAIKDQGKVKGQEDCLYLNVFTPKVKQVYS